MGGGGRRGFKGERRQARQILPLPLPPPSLAFLEVVRVGCSSPSPPIITLNPLPPLFSIAFLEDVRVDFKLAVKAAIVDHLFGDVDGSAHLAAADVQPVRPRHIVPALGVVDLRGLQEGSTITCEGVSAKWREADVQPRGEPCRECELAAAAPQGTPFTYIDCALSGCRAYMRLPPPLASPCPQGEREVQGLPVDSFALLLSDIQLGGIMGSRALLRALQGYFRELDVSGLKVGAGWEG